MALTDYHEACVGCGEVKELLMFVWYRGELRAHCAHCVNEVLKAAEEGDPLAVHMWMRTWSAPVPRYMHTPAWKQRLGLRAVYGD